MLTAAAIGALGWVSLARVLDRIGAPGSAAVVLERLWFRPPPPPSRRWREDRTPSHGRPVRVAWASGEVSGAEYGDPSGPTALLVHGWGGCWQQLSALVPPLVQRGWRVVALDAPGHGDSAPGESARARTTLVDHATSLAAAGRELGRPDLVVAHSAGGMSVLHAQDLGLPSSAGLVLVAPPTALAPMLARFGERVGVRRRTTLDRLETRVARAVSVPLSRFDLVARARREPPAESLLLVHDTGDVETPYAGSVALAEAWPAELVTTTGLGHRRLLRNPDVVRRIMAFGHELASRPRPEPSAATTDRPRRTPW